MASLHRRDNGGILEVFSSSGRGGAQGGRAAGSTLHGPGARGPLPQDGACSEQGVLLLGDCGMKLLGVHSWVNELLRDDGKERGSWPQGGQRGSQRGGGQHRSCTLAGGEQ